MRKTIVAVLLYAVMCIFAVSAAVIDGSYKIVVPRLKTAPAIEVALEEAGRELSAAFKESVGLEIEVVSSDDMRGEKKKKPAIWLGADAAIKARVMPADLKGMENMIVEKVGNVYIFGHDALRNKNHPKKMPWSHCVLPTVKAVTRFMEQYMDIRFLGPGRVGMDVPRIKKVEVPTNLSDRHLPPLDYAPGRYYTMLYGHAANCFGSGVYHSYGGHTYHKACPPEKYFKTHPEYFAMINGKRSLGPSKGQTALCISNPAIEELLVEELVARLDEGASGVQLAQNDGRLFCQCDKCTTYGGPKADTVGEKIWILHRRVAERVAKMRPGGIVNIIAYGATSTPPKTFREFPENVMVEVTHPSEARLKNWTENFKIPHGIVVYIYLWGNYPAPGFTAKRSFVRCAEDARMFRRYGVHGVYRCGFGELFGTEGPEYYLFNRLIDNPESDVHAVVKEYCDRSYGPASVEMLEFFNLLDQRLVAAEGIANLDGRQDVARTNPLELLAYMYSPLTIEALEAHLSCAEGLAATQKQKVRIALTRKEFDYAKNIGKIATFYASYQFKPSRNTFVLLDDAIEERNRIIDSIYGGNEDLDATPVKFKDWPEIKLFGGDLRRIMMQNGRLRARIGSPLRWNTKAMLEGGNLPGLSRKKAIVKRTEVAPEFGDFEHGAWSTCRWQTLNGILGDKPTVMSRFKILAGKDCLYVAVEGAMGKTPRMCGVGRDGPCRSAECFAMTVSPKDSTKAYYQFLWNVEPDSRWDGKQGHITDPLDPKFGKVDDSWNGEWMVKNEFKGGLWRSLVTLPYSTLDEKVPGRGSTWGFNIGRVADCGAEKSSFRLHMLWNPSFELELGVVNPETCGQIRFE